jgi:hypothetical protein
MVRLSYHLYLGRSLLQTRMLTLVQAKRITFSKYLQLSVCPNLQAQSAADSNLATQTHRK